MRRCAYCEQHQSDALRRDAVHCDAMRCIATSCINCELGLTLAVHARQVLIIDLV